MKKIRNNVFETNSSSTHSITICSKDDYDKWVNGELFYYNDAFYTEEERNKFLIDAGYSDEEIELVKNWKEDDNFDFDWWDIPLSNEQYYKNICSDYDEFNEHKNVNGVEIVAFGYYGNDY